MVTTEDVVLAVPDISCEHCVKTINGTLGVLSGVESVSTDIPTRSVHLRYNPGAVSMEQIEAALDDAGYTVAKDGRRLGRSVLDQAPNIIGIRSQSVIIVLRPVERTAGKTTAVIDYHLVPCR